jgi:hypothetical protein
LLSLDLVLLCSATPSSLKNWPRKELNGLFSRHVNEHSVILPVWHGVTKDDILSYSPLLSDLFAANSSEDLCAVAQSLVQVIRPEAFQLETSRQDGRNAAARIREHVKNAHPELDCRIIFGPQESDPLRMDGASTSSDVVFSRIQEATRIEVFAPDRAAYESNPISFKLRMKKEAWEKFQVAQQKGTVVEFGPEDELEFTSEFLSSLGTQPGVSSSGVQKLVVSPSPEAMSRRRRFKLTFSRGDDEVEFSYVEFEMIQPGQQEIEIRSTGPSLPLELTLVLNHHAGHSSMEVGYSYAGHEIRKVYKAHRAIQLFMKGGALEILDLESDQKLPKLEGARQTSPSDEVEAYWCKFIEAANEVVVALNEQLIWPERQTREDGVHLQLLVEVVRTGKVSVLGSTLTATLKPLAGIDIHKALAQHTMFRINRAEPPEFATVFGKTFDLGPYSVTSRIGEVDLNPVAGDPDCQVVRITPSEPLVFKFERFHNEEPTVAEPTVESGNSNG